MKWRWQKPPEGNVHAGYQKRNQQCLHGRLRRFDHRIYGGEDNRKLLRPDVRARGHLCALSTERYRHRDRLRKLEQHPTLNLTMTGLDNTALTLTGPVTGNSFALQGTVQGQIVTYYGYYEIVNNVPSTYLADATNPASLDYVGTLTLPH